MELLYNARKYQIHPPNRFWDELSLIRRILGHLLEGHKSQRKNRQKIFLNKQILPARVEWAGGRGWFILLGCGESFFEVGDDVIDVLCAD